MCFVPYAVFMLIFSGFRKKTEMIQCFWRFLHLLEKVLLMLVSKIGLQKCMPFSAHRNLTKSGYWCFIEWLYWKVSQVAGSRLELYNAFWYLNRLIHNVPKWLDTFQKIFKCWKFFKLSLQLSGYFAIV